MTSEPRPDGTPTASLSAFVVEMRAVGSPTRDLHGMHQALAYAVARLRARGTAITAGRSVILPLDFRCLSLLLAADLQSVVLARDTAGLSSASVHAAVPMRDAGDTGDWWRPTEPTHGAPRQQGELPCQP